MAGKKRGADRELDAIRTIMDALEPLEAQERSRVLDYVLKRLQMATLRAPMPAGSSPQGGSTTSSARTVVDIRTLKEEKKPRSANEMAALVAYYLSELAGPGEQADTVNADLLRRYFKMAGFRLPSQPRQTLPNAAAAGYLENAGRGEYRLNPVGYNLVVHGMPKDGSGASSDRQPKRRKKAAAAKLLGRKKKARR